MVPEVITLRDDQVAFADRLAERRQRNADQHRWSGRKGRATTGAAALELHRSGARAEMAACIYFRPAPWNQMRLGEADIGGFIDVKGRAKEWYELPVSPDAPDDWAFVLVDAHAHPTYRIVGWVWAFEAKRPELWRPAVAFQTYLVPRDHEIMKPPRDLLRLVLRMGTDANDPASICHVQGCGERRHPSLRI